MIAMAMAMSMAIAHSSPAIVSDPIGIGGSVEGRVVVVGLGRVEHRHLCP